MNDEANKHQIVVFERAQARISETLDDITLALDFPGMLQEIRRLVESLKATNGHPLRHFSRMYLGLSGEKYRTMVHPWLKLKLEMTEEDIILVLKTISGIHSGKFQNVPPAKVSNIPPGPLDRKMIDLIITMVNSLVEMMKKMPVSRSNVLDGDRMRIRTALKFVCDQLGLEAKFPEGKTHNIPLTAEDFAESGLTTFRAKGNK